MSDLPPTLPSGTVIAFAGSSTPKGTEWLMCDGRLLKIAEFPNLYAAIETNHGGDGTIFFRLPDYRGRFLRGVDRSEKDLQEEESGDPEKARFISDPDALQRTAMNPGGNTGRAVGSVQEDAMQGHKHQSEYNYFLTDSHGKLQPGAYFGERGFSTVGPPIPDGINGTPRTAKETRVKNAYVNFLIKT